MKTTEKLKWSEMGPRERDALVAQKVLGYERHGMSYVFDHPDTGEPCFSIVENWGGRLEPIPHYTTNPADCAKVVKEKFEEWMCLRRPGFLSDPYEVQIIHNDRLNHVQATGATEEEAFCKAALRASGVEIED